MPQRLELIVVCRYNLRCHRNPLAVQRNFMNLRQQDKKLLRLVARRYQSPMKYSWSCRLQGYCTAESSADANAFGAVPPGGCQNS
jgi:hypothetical protein